MQKKLLIIVKIIILIYEIVYFVYFFPSTLSFFTIICIIQLPSKMFVKQEIEKLSFKLFNT